MSKLEKDDQERRLKRKKIATDEIEAVAIVLQGNLALKKRVLNKIRELRGQSTESLTEIVAKGKNSKDRLKNSSE